jgi:predicted kinase
VTFDVTKADPAHGASFRAAIEALASGQNVVVDNTNLSAEEVVPYVSIAQAYRAEVEILTLRVDPETAFSRNTHGVPYAVCLIGDGPEEGTVAVHRTREAYQAETRRVSVVGGFREMVSRFETFEAPQHWQFLPWLSTREA